MQENKERLENKDELVPNEEEKISEVLENQANLFEGDEVFTEAMVVEKEQINVDSSAPEKTGTDSHGDTAIFTFAKDKQKAPEISHDELTVSDIESSAKEYYNANHADDIEDKVKQLCNLANVEFSDNGLPFEEVQTFEEVPPEDDEAEYEKKMKKKKKKRGVVSNDDMLLLSDDASGETLHSAALNDSAAFTKKEPTGEELLSEDIDLSGIEQAIEMKAEQKMSQQEAAMAAVNEQQAQEGVPDEAPDEVPAENTDSEEKHLFEALGTQEADAEEYLKKYEDMYAEDDVEYEYTSKEQDTDILLMLRKKAMGSVFSILFTLVAAIACIYFEIAAVTKLPNPAFLEAGKFGVTYAMTMLQIMFVAIIFNFDGMKRAFKGLRPSKSSAEAFTAVACIVCTLHTVVSSLLVGNDPSLRSFCSIGCVSLLMLSFNSFFKAQTALRAFCIAASKKPKLSCACLERTSDEAVAFEQYLDGDSTIISVEKSSFVEGFFKKLQRVPAATKHSFKRACIMLGVALVAAVAAGLRFSDVYAGFVTFTAVSLTALPVNALIMTSLPFFKLSAKAAETQTAFLGEAVCDAYDDASVISFDDTEVFPPRGVRVSSIKTFENNRIDKVILYMARIFDVVKGPLSYVFANSVHDIDEAVGNAEIKSFYCGGINAEIDGKNILVGQADFMRMNELVPVEDNVDETFIQSNGSIMYMAVDGAVAAKFYIKYGINNEFEGMLRSFYDAGMCVAVKTLDPCVTTQLVQGFLKGANYPLAVVNKGSQGIQMTEVSETTDSTIISLAGVHSFLKGFIKADKLRNIYRTNSGFSLISMIIGLVLSAAGILVLGTNTVGVLFMLVFQLVWCLPALLVSSFTR